MKRYLILITIALFTFRLYGQLLSPDPAGIDYYNRGSELIKLGDYTGADSLLTLALRSFKSENVYYNRAVSRLLQSDTLGYCQDMSIAANKYFDEQAKKLYNEHCCIKVDTIYYDKKRILSDISNYRYYEIISYPKYDSIINGSFHDRNVSENIGNVDFGYTNNLISINTSTTDLIAGYIIEDSVKYYTQPTQPVSIHNIYAYEDLKRRAKIALSAKYPKLKAANSNENLKVYFKVYFDDTGEVIKVLYIGFFPEIAYDIDIKELEKDLLGIADSYPKVSPAKFFNEKVCFVAYDFIEF